MKKVTGLFLAVLTVAAVSFPQDSHAESSFSFSVSDGPYYGGPRPGPRWHHGGHHHPHYYPSTSIVYVDPSPTVVYQPVPVQYVPASSIVASPASPSYMNEVGQTCREYQSVAIVGGRQSQVYGTACLQPDGAWRVVD